MAVAKGNSGLQSAASPPPALLSPAYLHQQPVAGIDVRPPSAAPAPGDVLLGYAVHWPQPGCCQLDGLTNKGWLATGVLLLVAWPLAWVPCLMSTFYEPYQRPVYGVPGQRFPGEPAAGVPAPAYESPALQTTEGYVKGGPEKQPLL